MEKLKRYITVFEKGEDDFIKGEFHLENYSLVEFQELFSIDKENPMFDCYEITEAEAKYFETKFNYKFDFNKYIYYLECFEDN